MSGSCSCGTCAACGGAARTMERPVGDPLRFRHAAIRQRMLDSIASSEVRGVRPLEVLGVRSKDDPAIALLDAHAASLHVLAWNGARLADDATISRSEDRDALVDLARLIGYEPRPALAASTTLAFTLDTLPGAPEIVRVPKGAKVASTPGQDELPQIFETDLDLEARGAWNAIPAACPLPSIDGSSREVCVAGLASAAKPGDLLATPCTSQAGGALWLIGRIASVERMSDPAETQTPFLRFHLVDRRTVATTTGLASARAGKVSILARRAAPFGATAPDVNAMNKEIKESPLAEPNSSGGFYNWSGFEVGAPGSGDEKTIDLDAAYQEAFVDQLVLLARSNKGKYAHGRPHKPSTKITASASMSLKERSLATAEEEVPKNQPQEPTLTRIVKVIERARTDFLLSAKVSRIKLEAIDLSKDAGAPNGTSASLRYLVRELAVFLETETLLLYLPPLDVALPDQADRLVAPGAIALPPGRKVVISGQQWMNAPGKAGPQIAELATIREVQANADGTTTLFFEREVTARFRSTRLRLLGNCVGATHGETPASGEEIIGSGDAGASNQRFALKGKPLTQIPAETPRGYAPALDLRVGGRSYTEVPHLMGRGSADRVFTVRMGREGQTVIQIAGKLPTAANNVTALYRTGGGKAGNLGPDRINMAMTPTLGVSKIANPVKSDGGSDAETVEDIRRAAPRSVRTLDKVVSLADYEAFATAYRGVGKALATLLYSNMRQIVCLTLADTDLQPPGPTSGVVTGLTGELARVAAPGRSVRIEGFVPLHPEITLAMVTDPAFRRKDVEAAVRARLGEKFGAAARPFARALHRSEVLAEAQAVDGVLAATLTRFHLPAGNGAESEGRLPCPGPFLDPVTRVFTAARLLSIDPALVLFGEMQP